MNKFLFRHSNGITHKARVYDNQMDALDDAEYFWAHSTSNERSNLTVCLVQKIECDSESQLANIITKRDADNYESVLWNMGIHTYNQKLLQHINVLQGDETYKQLAEVVNYNIVGGFLTLNKGRDGNIYAWYMDETNNVLCNIDTLEIIDDISFIEEQFC